MHEGAADYVHLVLCIRVVISAVERMQRLLMFERRWSSLDCKITIARLRTAILTIRVVSTGITFTSAWDTIETLLGLGMLSSTWCAIVLKIQVRNDRTFR